MRLLIAGIAFTVTLGGLFLFENYKTRPSQPNYAQIIRDITQETVLPSLRPSKSPSQKAVTKSSKSKSSITSTSSQTTIPKPVSSATQAMHIYYTSSYKTSKYYYCDTDSGWKTLSPQTLKSFSSVDELLRNYPSRALHAPCK